LELDLDFDFDRELLLFVREFFMYLSYDDDEEMMGVLLGSLILFIFMITMDRRSGT
jgi:hypothetical protein